MAVTQKTGSPQEHGALRGWDLRGPKDAWALQLPGPPREWFYDAELITSDRKLFSPKKHQALIFSL